VGYIKGLLALLKVIWSTILSKAVMEAVGYILKTTGRETVDDLFAMAEAKVLAVEAKYPSGNGELKKNEVFQYLTDVVAARGLGVSASVLNFLIEAALTSLKAAGAVG